MWQLLVHLNVHMLKNSVITKCVILISVLRCISNRRVPWSNYEIYSPLLKISQWLGKAFSNIDRRRDREEVCERVRSVVYCKRT